MVTIGVGTNRKLIDLFNMMKSGALILRPYFQRNLVWNEGHKEAFIDTILEGLPFPEVYFADGEIDVESQKSKTLVVDGQQRMSTIHQYISGSNDFQVKHIKPFAKLNKDEKTNFLDYMVVVRDLGRLSDERIIEIFKRINSVQYALNSIEINNALYQGEFISAAKDIVGHCTFISEWEVFSDSDFSRMKDLEFILLVLSTIEEGGYFTGATRIETYVEDYNEEYPNKASVSGETEDCLKLIHDCSLLPDSVWFRKSNMFTLIIELITFKRRFALFPKQADLKRRLVEFEKQLIESKNDNIDTNPFAEYYYYVYQSTSSRKARVIRGNLLGNFLEKLK